MTADEAFAEELKAHHPDRHELSAHIIAIYRALFMAGIERGRIQERNSRMDYAESTKDFFRESKKFDSE